MIPPGFDAFWAVWPKNTQTYSRKGGKSECLKRWVSRHHETQADQIVKHVAWLKTTADWLKDGGAYIPAPLVYLNQQRWDGAEIPQGKPQSTYEESRALIEAMERDRKASQSPESIEARKRALSALKRVA